MKTKTPITWKAEYQEKRKAQHSAIQERISVRFSPSCTGVEFILIERAIHGAANGRRMYLDFPVKTKDDPKDGAKVKLCSAKFCPVGIVVGVHKRRIKAHFKSQDVLNFYQKIGVILDINFEMVEPFKYKCEDEDDRFYFTSDIFDY